MSISVERTALAKRRLGRSELKIFSDWSDGRPETELNFKFYRQATHKIVGISDEAAAFLRGFFLRDVFRHTGRAADPAGKLLRRFSALSWQK